MIKKVNTKLAIVFYLLVFGLGSILGSISELIVCEKYPRTEWFY